MRWGSEGLEEASTACMHFAARRIDGADRASGGGGGGGGKPDSDGADPAADGQRRFAQRKRRSLQTSQGWSGLGGREGGREGVSLASQTPLIAVHEAVKAAQGQGDN